MVPLHRLLLLYSTACIAIGSADGESDKNEFGNRWQLPMVPVKVCAVKCALSHHTSRSTANPPIGSDRVASISCC